MAVTLYLSGRAQDKVLRAARRISELAGEESVSATHLSEAMQYHRPDRQLWKWCRVRRVPWSGKELRPVSSDGLSAFGSKEPR
jgi:hypothetical protein